MELGEITGLSKSLCKTYFGMRNEIFQICPNIGEDLGMGEWGGSRIGDGAHSVLEGERD